MKSCNALRMKCRIAVLAVAVASCVAAIMLSCSESTCPSTSDEPLPHPNRMSPDSLINFFAEAYDSQDIDAYSEALGFYYEFEFTPDVVDTLGLPDDKPWWGKEEDVSSTENMFNNPEVTGVEMYFPPAGVGGNWEKVVYRHIAPDGDDPGDEPDTTEIEGLGKEFEPDIKVHINRPGEDLLTLWVNNSVLDVWVTKDRDYEGLWTIMRIQETEKPTAYMRTQAEEIKGKGR